MIELGKQCSSYEFLYKKTPRIPKGIKIREGVEILHSTYKAKGGLIRTSQEVKKDIIENIGISSDFQFFPKSKLIKVKINLGKQSVKKKS